MDAERVFRTLDLIPDRVARTSSGASFAAAATSCVHPERLALLAEFLHWLSPIYPITRDDQTCLGLFAAKHVEVEDEALEPEEETLV